MIRPVATIFNYEETINILICHEHYIISKLRFMSCDGEPQHKQQISLVEIHNMGIKMETSIMINNREPKDTTIRLLNTVWRRH